MITIVIERKEIKKMELNPTNHLEIESTDLDLCLNIRDASLIRDYKKRNIAIISNIIVAIQYDSKDDTQQGKSLPVDNAQLFKEDFLLLKDFMKLSMT